MVSLKTSPDQVDIEKGIRAECELGVCEEETSWTSSAEHMTSVVSQLCNTEEEPTNAGTDYPKPLTFSSSRNSRCYHTQQAEQSQGDWLLKTSQIGPSFLTIRILPSH